MKVFPNRLEDMEIFSLNNVYLNSKGNVKRFAYKTLAGLIREIKRANSYGLKHGFKSRLIIDLPVKERNGR